MPELAKAYEPQQVEDRLYARWQESGLFRANPESGKAPYSIVMPPPNVTGKLTLGHVLNTTIQDILARKARMEGKEVLWLPGTDHAGLATQTAVEKHLWKAEGKRRQDFSREELVARIWQWKEEFGGIITQQLRKIGCSCDWSRERFTMDADYARAVQEAFVQLYDEGLIYRGTRMVNWCPGSLTAISDEEVIPTKQKGFLYYVRYELVGEGTGAMGKALPPPASVTITAEEPSDSPAASVVLSLSKDPALVTGHAMDKAGFEDVSNLPPPESVLTTLGEVPDSPAANLVLSAPAAGPVDVISEEIPWLIVATTRPETIMADVALAVKPGGKWAHLIGRKVIRPLHRTEIPIIGDEAVEEGFGTGVLKVTPAHDKVDYEIGKRHGLEFRDILTPGGKINDPGEHDASELHGADRFEARKRSAELLRERGLLEKEEGYENNVGFSERAGVPIEPRLSSQWFLKYPNIPEALALVRAGHVKFHPEHWTKTYEHWLENIQDWCISRQVWWGHRIPVWYRDFPPLIRSGSTPNEIVGVEEFYRKEDAAGVIHEADELQCQIESPGADWVQDKDSLDTWFSSWLWAYATMRTDDGTRQKFYPTSALVTGPDIIFLWVARMLIAGLHFKPSGEKSVVPTEPYPEAALKANLAFRDVYFTGLIRDKQGRKLSKSLGNSPDPLDLIAKYGADGLRFGLVRIAPQGSDIRFDEKQIEEGRNFCNKLWNICRYRTLQGPVDSNAEPWKHKRSIFADELLDRLHSLLEGERNALVALNEFNFSEGASQLYDFVWNEFASRYVEASKGDFATADSPTRDGTLATFDYVLSHVLRLLHPFAPFVTEELWCELGFRPESVQLAAWPKKSPRPKTWSTRAREIYQTADTGRQLRGEVKLPSNQKVPFFLVPNALISAEHPLTDEQKAVLAAFLNASDITVLDKAPANPGPKAFTQLGELYLPASGLVDPAVEKDRLTKELVKVEKDLVQTRQKLGDPNMLAKAPPQKVETWRALETSLVEKEKSLRESLARLP